MRLLVLEPDEYYHPPFLALEGTGDEVIIRKDAESGKRVLAEKMRPDVLVMELLLPDHSGYEFLREIRSQYLLSELPVIIFSKIQNFEDIQQSLNLGVSGYFVKGQDPFRDVQKLLLSLKPT